MNSIAVGSLGISLKFNAQVGLWVSTLPRYIQSLWISETFWLVSIIVNTLHPEWTHKGTWRQHKTSVSKWIRLSVIHPLITFIYDNMPYFPQGIKQLIFGMAGMEWPTRLLDTRQHTPTHGENIQLVGSLLSAVKYYLLDTFRYAAWYLLVADC